MKLYHDDGNLFLRYEGGEKDGIMNGHGIYYYFDGKTKSYYIKRFQIETTTLNAPFSFISKERASKLLLVTLYESPSLFFNYRLNNGDKKEKEIVVNDFVGVKGWKAIGNKILKHKNMSGFKFSENQAEKEPEDNTSETLTLF